MDTCQQKRPSGHAGQFSLALGLALGFCIVFSSPGVASEPYDEQHVIEAINTYFTKLEPKPSQQLALSIRSDQLASDEGIICKQAPPRSDEGRDTVLGSAEYQRIERRCSSSPYMGIAVEKGLVKQTEKSPYVYHYELTSFGREKVFVDESNAMNYFRYIVPVVENILEIEASTNRYNVPILHVRYSVVSELTDWAAGVSDYENRLKMIRRRGDRAQYLAELWETDQGLDIFHVKQLR
ncbi:hypothetical protein R5M92_04335 [Halomonas sp. Bachu 37]|uniref:hypothetical protein n=1 Tax=Halomonas kashgarensis TaxID=3084920 RepID=UPI00321776E9